MMRIVLTSCRVVSFRFFSYEEERRFLSSSSSSLLNIGFVTETFVKPFRSSPPPQANAAAAAAVALMEITKHTHTHTHASISLTIFFHTIHPPPLLPF